MIDLKTLETYENALQVVRPLVEWGAFKRSEAMKNAAIAELIKKGYPGAIINLVIRAIFSGKLPRIQLEVRPAEDSSVVVQMGTHRPYKPTEPHARKTASR